MSLGAVMSASLRIEDDTSDHAVALRPQRLVAGRRCQIGGAVPSSGEASERVVAFADEFRARAAETEANRSLPRDLFERLAHAGAFRLFIPEELGGSGLRAVELYRVTRVLATADPAAAWVVGQSAAFGGSMSVKLDRDVLELALSDPLCNFVGSGIPAGRATPAPGGYVVRGRWPWTTGNLHATWLAGLALAAGEDGRPVPMFCFAPAADVELHDDWDALGMRGTGSGDISFHDVFVPSGRVVPTAQPPVHRGSTLASLHEGVWYVALASSATLVGCARLALSEVERLLVEDKRLLFSSTRHRESGHVQRIFAEAEAALDAVDLLAEHTLEDLWERAAQGAPPDPARRARVRAALSHVAQTAARVTDELGDLATGDAVRRGTPLERCLRDARTHRAHASIYPAVQERAGRIRLGVVDDDPVV